MLGVATQLDRLAVLHGDDHAARIGAIVRANGVNGLKGMLHVNLI